MVIDRELESRVYRLYSCIDRHINSHSATAEDVYVAMIDVLIYIMVK